MSTRASIVIKEGRTKIHVYHHCDGYPEGVGKDLTEFMKKFPNWYADIIATELIKRGTSEDNDYECSAGLHGDIDYIYEINCRAKKLTCYRRGYEEEPNKCMNAKHVVKMDF